ISNTNMVPLVQYNTDEVVATRTLGSGNIVFLAFDYYAYDDNTEKLIANSLSWMKSMKGESWLHVSADSGTLSAGDTTTIYVTFSNDGIVNGTYTMNLIFSSNDPLHPFDTIPVTLTVQSAPCTSFSHTDADCNGNVCFSDSSLSATSW